MKLTIFPALAATLALVCCTSKNEVDLHSIAVKVSENGLARTDLGHYMGVFLYHSMAELALASGDSADMERVTDVLKKIHSGEIPVHYTKFIDYEIGGQAAALLAYRGENGFDSVVNACALKMWGQQPRTSGNIMTSASAAQIDCYWIDIAFTVTPFFLYTGLLEGNNEYIDYAAWMPLQMCSELYDTESGLYHQGYNHARCPGISQDCWSRGNGWMSMALSSLLKDYPRDGKYWNDIVNESRRFYANVCKYQDETGMWHQELTDPSSYVETSGSGQILAGLGAAIESGVIDKEEYMPYFIKGLKGLLLWVDPDGSVGHCCRGNLVPGKGRKEDYTPIHWYFNENHSFGPVVLALAQAINMGIDSIELDAPLGSANDKDRPRAYARIISEFKDHLAWENDRIAVRVYSQKSSTTKKLSGIDLWAKTVDYSIIDEWYGKQSRGESYHQDTGTGCDWYDMGAGRGIGGTGIWDGTQLYCALPYSSAYIESDGPEKLSFTLVYDAINVGNDKVFETKKIDMLCGTSFFKVSETIRTESGNPVTLAVGVQDFGSAEVICDTVGKLFIGEVISSEKPIGKGSDSGIDCFKGFAGSAIIVNPDDAAGTASFEGNLLQLVTVNSGDTIEYYAGATWNFQQNSGRWNGGKQFWLMTASETSWASLHEYYKQF